MGVEGLLPHGPGGDKYHRQFLDFDWRKERIALDAAGLLHECARNHASSYRPGDYFPSLKEFQQEIFYMQSILRWNFHVVFDIQDSTLKEVEHQRRRQLRDVHFVRSGSDDVRRRRPHTWKDWLDKGRVLWCLTCGAWWYLQALHQDNVGTVSPLGRRA
jgi:hypothetical protein